jgi:hypothetical protein
MGIYAVINVSSSLVENLIEWDGIQYFETGSDYILVDVETTSSLNFSDSPVFLDSVVSIFPDISSGSFTGSFNDYSGSLGWLDNFASSSRSGSFTGSFTGSLNGTASFSSTASYVSSIKSGRITIAQWGIETIGGNYTASVSFNSNYDDTSYSVSLTCGADVRTLSLTNKQTSGFTVNSNSSSPMTDDVYWITIPYNNP